MENHIEAIARFGHDYMTLRDVGPATLFQRFQFDPRLATADAIHRALIDHPDWVQDWFGYSHSRRHVMPGWHLGHTRDASGAVTGAYVQWIRASIDAPPGPPTSKFTSESLGAAEFARRVMEDLATNFPTS